MEWKWNTLFSTTSGMTMWYDYSGNLPASGVAGPAAGCTDCPIGGAALTGRPTPPGAARGPVASAGGHCSPLTSPIATCA